MSVVLAWVVPVAYGLGWLVTAPLIARALGRDFGHSDKFDRFMEAAMGLVGGLLWPLAAPIMLVRWLADVESPSERRRRRQIEKDERVRELQAKIARLERELGIGQRATNDESRSTRP